MRKTALTLTLLLAFCQLLLWAQVSSPANPASPADTLAVAAEEDSLSYAADSVSYNQAKEQIRLYGRTNVQYQEFTINSDSLLVDLKAKRAYSYGDTVMRDGDQILIGSDVSYDIDTQTGIMTGGSSRLEQGFYTGQNVRKVDKDIYDVDDGSFTTCENAEPDFWFTASKLRVYRGDKIVGKPVIAYVNHLPVFYFPYIVVPIRRGRYPGFLIPEPGYNSVDGKFVKGISW
ncbi:MAG TPA: LPS-assembly protein LptD, partial [Candidatus Syntrophosphaera sp.]|nr:LPS-assembly protein LptD [Candidatus Syntrophosphaera sp.]